MKRFKNILMLYTQRTGDEEALDKAAALARKNAAKLTLVEIHEHTTSPIQKFFSERQTKLEELMTSKRFEDVDLDCRVLQGLQFLELTRLVLKDGFDLVVMSADRVQGFQNLAIGTSAMHVLRKCPCPVWVIQPGCNGQFRRIMAAVAPETNGEATSLDLKVLQMASSLAREEKARLDIVHAWDYSGKDLETSRSEMTPAIQEQLLSRNEWSRRDQLDSLLDRVDMEGIDHEVQLLQGQPELRIPAFAAAEDVDLIVMGTLRRGGIPGFLIGSTAENLLRMIDCSVLAVKPEGFVSPVSLQA
ncbi:MAG: universal stress protein [Pseudomonadales bacterium]|nr:universal stress protein [Pseudomonadales bacterium]